LINEKGKEKQMPAVQFDSTTRGSRKDIGKRSKRQALISRKNKPAAPAIIANSIYELALRPKLGIETLINKSQSLPMDVEDPRHLFDDLWSCYCQYYKILYGHSPHYILLPNRISLPLSEGANPIKEYGVPIDLAFYGLITAFQLMVPSGAYFGISKREFGYQKIKSSRKYIFYLYAPTDSVHAFGRLAIKPFIDSVKNNVKLEDLLYSFLKTFIDTTHIEPWWGAHSYFEDSLEEEVFHMANGDLSEYDDYSIEDLTVLLKSYQAGKIKNIENRIRKAPVLTVNELKRKISRFDKRHPVIKMIRNSFPLLSAGCSVYNFDTQLLCEEDFCGLHFDMQNGLVYDADDPCTAKIEEWVDCYANEGVADPLFQVLITEDLTKSFEQLLTPQIIEWPEKLYDFCVYCSHLIKKRKRNA
jgi:hypothetical protein